MELLLTKEQKSGMMGIGAVKFIMHIKARLTPEETELLKKYKMDDLILYEKLPLNSVVPNMGGMTSMLVGIAARALDFRFLVKDLVNGKTVEVKDIGEMLVAEAQIKEAAENFHTLLMAAANFKGEEIIKYE